MSRGQNPGNSKNISHILRLPVSLDQIIPSTAITHPITNNTVLQSSTIKSVNAIIYLVVAGSSIPQKSLTIRKIPGKILVNKKNIPPTDSVNRIPG